jgi:hypothetical protein
MCGTNSRHDTGSIGLQYVPEPEHLHHAEVEQEEVHQAVVRDQAVVHNDDEYHLQHHAQVIKRPSTLCLCRTGFDLAAAAIYLGDHGDGEKLAEPL